MSIIWVDNLKLLRCCRTSSKTGMLLSLIYTNKGDLIWEGGRSWSPCGKWYAGSTVSLWQWLRMLKSHWFIFFVTFFSCLSPSRSPISPLCSLCAIAVGQLPTHCRLLSWCIMSLPPHSGKTQAIWNFLRFPPLSYVPLHSVFAFHMPYSIFVTRVLFNRRVEILHTAVLFFFLSTYINLSPCISSFSVNRHFSAETNLLGICYKRRVR